MASQNHGSTLAFALALALALPSPASGQTNLIIYNGALASGWQNSSYNAAENLSATAPVYSGKYSAAVSINSAWGAFAIYHLDMNDSAYEFLSFWINGGPSGGQNLQLYGTLGTPIVPQNQRYYLDVPAANTWQQCLVPLAALGVGNATNFTGFAIQDAVGSSEPTFYVDDIELVNLAAPTVAHLNINASQPIRTADARWFGMNAAIWDNMFDTAHSISTLADMGTGALRFPGGSDSDDYHWLYDRQDNNDWTWSTTLANFIHVVTNVNAETMITLNYGTGSTNEAAAWVAYVNATTDNTQPLGVDAAGTNWRTAGYWASLRASAPLETDDGKNFLRIGRKAPLGFKDWEIGNEEYGSWETDSNSVPHDPYTYAARAHDYISLIKAVDPTVKIGVVVTPGEDSYVNNTSHPVVNPRAGLTHYGWTPVVLATLKSLGTPPDFLIHHVYPQNPGGETDVGLLQASGGWASQAANLRQQITDYIGPAGTNIELVCTENNSVSSNPGKQSMSLVNGLFKMDSLARLMQTEFNGLFWWNLRNGSVSVTGNTNNSLYGWREYGDYGVLEGYNYAPTYYTTKLMQDFVQTGDTVLAATSDYLLLSSYAVRRQDGRLTILTINKDPTNSILAQVGVSGFTSASAGVLYSYGIPQDTAAETVHGSPDVAQTNLFVPRNSFSYLFPPYSATVFSLSPAPASLAAVLAGNQLVFQVQGQSNVPYVIQNSTNLLTWTSVSTNIFQSASANVTNAMAPGHMAQFWRVIWQP
jgi:hypothetical protein